MTSGQLSMPPTLRISEISPTEKPISPQTSQSVPGPTPFGTLVDFDTALKNHPVRKSLNISETNGSDEESDHTFNSEASTPTTVNEPDSKGQDRASGLIDNEEILGFQLTSSPSNDAFHKMVDFVTVLEENIMLYRASRASMAPKPQNKKQRESAASSRSSQEKATDVVEKVGGSESFSSSGAMTGASSSTGTSSRRAQRILDEKEQIMKLFKVDGMIDADNQMSDSLLPQHRALGRVVKHIFCQVDADAAKTNDDNARASIQACISKHAARLVKHPICSGFFMVLTVYMLFAPDLVRLWGNRELDDDFLLVNTVIFFLFLTEFFLFILGQQKQYLFSANIWMDVLSLLSILVDSLLISVAGNQQEGATIMRMARSSRMTRLARMARVARVTRLIPRLLKLCRRDKMQLAKVVLLRRLWRLFCFMDTDTTGFINTFDLRCVYLTIMQECGNIVNSTPDSRLQLLGADVRWLVSQKAVKERHSVGFEEFLKIMLGTGLGKRMEEYHREDVAADRGVLSLTQALGDSTAMKVCIGIIILIGVMSILEVERPDTSAQQGLVQLHGIARAWHADRESWDENFLCKHINDYTEKHKVDYIFLDGYTYWLHGRCLKDGVPEAEFDPLAYVEDFIEESSLRRSEFIKACWKGCTSTMTSLALVDNLESHETNALTSFTTTTTVIFLLLLFVYILNMGITKFSKTMLEPLRALSDDMTALACMDLVHIDKEMPAGEKGDRAVKVAEELRALQKSFLSMKHAVKSWSKYVPPSVVQRLFAAGIEAKIGVMRSYVSIFFCDISGFEDICCGLSPHEVLALLSTVLEKVAETIHKNNGTLLEFIGDEVLAVFNTPNSTKHHAFQAVRSASEVHAIMQSLPPTVTHENTGAKIETKIRMRCGVNTAHVLAGNLGSSQRMKYGVLGDGVNLTARLKGLNSRYKSLTLISEYTLQDPLCKRRFITRPVDLVAVKGRTEPTLVYELLQPTLHGDSKWMKDAVAKHTQGYDLYLKREFKEAKALFEEVSTKFSAHALEDAPSRLLISRCDGYMKDPPPQGWDGCERLTKKTF